MELNHKLFLRANLFYRFCKYHALHNVFLFVASCSPSTHQMWNWRHTHQGKQVWFLFNDVKGGFMKTPQLQTSNDLADQYENAWRLSRTKLYWEEKIDDVIGHVVWQQYWFFKHENLQKSSPKQLNRLRQNFTGMIANPQGTKSYTAMTSSVTWFDSYDFSKNL